MMMGRLVLLLFAFSCGAEATSADDIFLSQGTMCGEVTGNSVLVQTRLCGTESLNDQGDIPGAGGVVWFEYGSDPELAVAQRTPLSHATAERDFIVRAQLSDLKPGTTYFYRAVYGENTDSTKLGPTCSFKTLPGQQSQTEVKFIVGSCMNYIKFMHGKAGKASGPVTATTEDKQLGFPAFRQMEKLKPAFFVGTGDIVYYDNPLRTATTVPELRNCWHEQFRFPRMISFFENVPAYWSKDDHDFRFNDSDHTKDKLPNATTGIDLFREQLPIVAQGDAEGKTYRTHRVNKHLQIWLTEGRDYRSPNKMDDGPEKTIWGAEQRAWLKRTLKASDAKWKILITPTPMVGPDDAYKKDNHANLNGFRHEANEFFEWLNENGIDNLITMCGDRHWQYHSIHPAGIQEFACGALNDENSRMGVNPGSKRGTDPQGLVKQLFTSPKPAGGFIVVNVSEELKLEFHRADGEVLYQVNVHGVE